MILVTFDESENGAESCCGEANGPNTPNNGGLTKGQRRRQGRGGDGVSLHRARHDPGLRLQPLLDVALGRGQLRPRAPRQCHARRPSARSAPTFSAGPAASQATKLKVRPRTAPAGRSTTFRFRLLADLPLCRQGATIRFAGRRVKANLKGIARLRVALRGRRRRTAEATPAMICRPARAKVKVTPRGYNPAAWSGAGERG